MSEKKLEAALVRWFELRNETLADARDLRKRVQAFEAKRERLVEMNDDLIDAQDEYLETLDEDVQSANDPLNTIVDDLDYDVPSADMVFDEDEPLPRQANPETAAAKTLRALKSSVEYW